MKIEAKVSGVLDKDGELELKLKGWPDTAPVGTIARDYEIAIPATARSKRAFHIGRKVRISIEAAR